MSKKSIIIIGPFPPPIGGVSIHVSRLASKLKDDYNIYKIDTSRNMFIQSLLLAKLILQFKIKSTQFIVHNHIFKIKLNAIIVFLCKVFQIKYVQTIHSFRLSKNNLSKNQINLIKFIISNSYSIITVSEKIKDDFAQYDQSACKKICVIPAFIPYEHEASKTINDKYINSLGINDFISSHRILLCANAYKIVFYNNEDLYGIDLCIELMKIIKDLNNFNVGLIFMLPQIGNYEYYNTMKNRIREYGIEKDFVFVNKETELVPLFEYVDIFLRPTNTDGDALSIREALYSGIPCIASDAVERPMGTVLFKNRDVIDLYEKVNAMILNIKEEKNRAKRYGILQEDFIKRYFSIYD